MVSIREFIPDHKKSCIEQAFSALREQINFDEAMNQINLALYTFQDAVSSKGCREDNATIIIIYFHILEEYEC